MDFRGFRLWYRSVGRQESGLPLLCLHGGPGIPHDYLEPLEGLASTGRCVVFYDQLGCGNSDRPSDPSFWTVETFVDEVRTVRAMLGLERLHVFGHSVGGALALEYALTEPEGLAGLVLASSFASMSQFLEEQLDLVDKLEPGARQRVLELTEAGRMDDPEYGRIVDRLFNEHMTRTHPWPDFLSRAFEKMGADVYRRMWGTAGQFRCDGILRDWDVRERLPGVTVPTLITHGRYDYAVPRLGETLHEGIPDSRLVVFDDSAHLSFIDETEAYLRTVSEFLDEVEAGATG